LLLIFDWDGTLSDSTGIITRAMQRAAADLGWPVPEPEAVHNIIGLGLPEALNELYPDRREAGYEALKERYRRHYLAEDQAAPARFFPQVMETLTQLRDQGHRLAVATGKSRQGLDRVFEAMALHGFFHASRCADETASKPHPLMLRELLEELDGKPEAAVMVGDTEYDMAMAQSAGMARIAVSYGAHAVERLQAYEPALFLDQFGDIRDWPALCQVS